MTGFMLPRKCSCGRPLWAFMGEPEGIALLVTMCMGCDTLETKLAPVIKAEADDSGAPAQKA